MPPASDRSRGSPRSSLAAARSVSTLRWKRHRSERSDQPWHAALASAASFTVGSLRRPAAILAAPATTGIWALSYTWLVAELALADSTMPATTSRPVIASPPICQLPGSDVQAHERWRYWLA